MIPAAFWKCKQIILFVLLSASLTFSPAAEREAAAVRVRLITRRDPSNKKN